MSYAAARAVIEDRIQANWTATPVAWENVAFDPAAPGDGFPAGGPFLALTVLWGNERQASFGDATNLYRNTGVLQLHIRTAIGTGTAQAHQLLDDAAVLFRGQQIAGFTFWSASPEPGEEEREAGGGTGWYRLTMNVPFKLDEFH